MGSEVCAFWKVSLPSRLNVEKISFCPVVDGDDEIADPLADLKAESPVVVSFQNMNDDA